LQQVRKPKPKPAPKSLDELEFLLASTVPPPSAPSAPVVDVDLRSDDDFKPKNPSQETHHGTAVSPVNWKAVPAQARKAAYGYIKANIPSGSDLHSSAGQQILHQVVGLFPPGTMDLNGLKAIFTEQRSREQQQEAAKAARNSTAAAGAGAVPGSSAPPSAITAPKATPQPSAGAMTPRAAGDNSEKPAPGIQAQAQAQPPTSLAAAAAAAGAAAAAAAAGTGAITKTPPPSTAKAIGPSDHVAQKVGPSTNPPSTAKDASAAAAADADGTKGNGSFSDDDLLATGLSHGGNEADLRQLLQLASSCGMYQRVMIRTLILAGPSGISVADMASNAVNLGMETWEPTSSNVKNGLSRQTKNESVAVLAGYKYALKCFPGVVDTKPERLGGKGGGTKAGKEEENGAGD
jgi:hypothetical protein